MAPTPKTAARAAAAPAAPETSTTSSAPLPTGEGLGVGLSSRAYLEVLGVDETTGELTERPRFKYLPGHPRQIRFDAKAGQFNIGGETNIGNKVSFIPVALRVFEDTILNMPRKVWAEVFYVDDKGILCAVLFHGYSVENLLRLNSELFYDDLKLTAVVLTAKATKKENKKVGGHYYIAEFTFEPADAAEVQARQEFAEDFDLYREETLTGTAQLRIVQGYRVPASYQFPEPQPAQLPASTTAAA